jgi:hypothetical protein
VDGAAGGTIRRRALFNLEEKSSCRFSEDAGGGFAPYNSWLMVRKAARRSANRRRRASREPAPVDRLVREFSAPNELARVRKNALRDVTSPDASLFRVEARSGRICPISVIARQAASTRRSGPAGDTRRPSITQGRHQISCFAPAASPSQTA